MPLIPFADRFDPRAPRRHPAPVLWLRSHSPRWAFPRAATNDEIDQYLIWLHIYRVGQQLAGRERALRPPFSFRLRLAFHRLRIFLRAAGGDVPPDATRELERDDDQEQQP